MTTKKDVQSINQFTYLSFSDTTIFKVYTDKSKFPDLGEYGHRLLFAASLIVVVGPGMAPVTLLAMPPYMPDTGMSLGMDGMHGPCVPDGVSSQSLWRQTSVKFQSITTFSTRQI